VIRGEQAEKKLDSCKFVVNGLNKIISKQDLDLQAQITKVKSQNDIVAKAKEDYRVKSVELQQEKDKKRPWYEWAILGAVFFVGLSAN